MNVKWYEEHLEEVIHENQALKKQISQEINFKMIINKLKNMFAHLFTDVPSIQVQKYTQETVEEVINYYQQSSALWLKTIRNKLAVLETTTDMNRKIIILGNQGIYPFKQEYKCAKCGQSTSSLSYQGLSSRMAKLERITEELYGQVEFLEMQEQKYIKQICELRSISKKLEFQLAKQIKMTQKKDKIGLKSIKSFEDQILRLAQQVTIWKGEYQRIWTEKIRLEMHNQEDNTGQINNRPQAEILTLFDNNLVIKNKPSNKYLISDPIAQKIKKDFQSTQTRIQ